MIERRILERIRAGGIVRPREMRDLSSNPNVYLRVLEARGEVQRIGRGLYAASGFHIGENHSLAQAAKLVPDGVACLLSALTFHGVGTQNPSQVWMALNRPPSSAGGSGADAPPIRLLRFSGPCWERGVEFHEVEGTSVRVYSLAKTVADCFRCRNKIGLDAAVEALRECFDRRLCHPDDIWRHARACRAGAAILPHLEALA